MCRCNCNTCISFCSWLVERLGVEASLCPMLLYSVAVVDTQGSYSKFGLALCCYLLTQMLDCSSPCIVAIIIPQLSAQSITSPDGQTWTGCAKRQSNFDSSDLCLQQYLWIFRSLFLLRHSGQGHVQPAVCVVAQRVELVMMKSPFCTEGARSTGRRSTNRRAFAWCPE